MSVIPTSLVGPFWVGDAPGTTRIAFVDDEGDPYDFDGFTAATVILRRQNGPVVSDDLTATIDGAEIVIVWPAESVLVLGGLYSIDVTITGTGTTLAAEPVQLVVQARDGWLTLRDLRAEWADAPDSDVSLYKLAAAARKQCLVEGPALADDAFPPEEWLVAQHMQAKAIWNSAKSNGSADAIGMDGYQIRLSSMAAPIRNLLRPKRGVPGVG